MTDETQKLILVQIRLSPTDKEKIKLVAKDLGLPLTSFMRMVCLDKVNSMVEVSESSD